MARLSALDVQVDLPPGWDGRLYRRQPAEVGAQEMGTASSTYAVLHAASFPLPAERGDYGSGAVELMGRGDVLVTLVEHGPQSAGTALFATAGPPRQLSARAFSPNGLLRAIPGQAGAQVFFSVNGRAFCLYVVLGDHNQADRLVPVVNSVLQSLQLGA